MYLNALEEKRLLRIANARTRVYYTALKYSQTPLRPSEFFSQARVHIRRGQAELEALVKLGFIRDTCKTKKGWGRELQYVSAIGFDRRDEGSQRSDSIADSTIGFDRRDQGSQRSDPIASSFRDPDLPSGERLHKTEPSVRTGRGAGEGENGRTDGSKKFAEIARRLVGSIASDWDIPRPAVEKCVGRFFVELELVEPAATESELWRYFRAAFQHREQRHTHPAFAGIVLERFLGCACTRLRFELWREHEDKREALRLAARERELEQNAVDKSEADDIARTRALYVAQGRGVR